MPALLECVPNFSEGKDLEVIRRITGRIEAVEGIRILDIDPGKAANRTVVTFVGPPAAVAEAAFNAISQAAEPELIEPSLEALEEILGFEAVAVA